MNKDASYEMLSDINSTRWSIQVQPLPKKLFEKAKQLKLAEILLEFSGGSDEGYLYVYLTSCGHPDDEKPDGREHNPELYAEIEAFSVEVEEWAWLVYEYTGGGDGSGYGDNIVYNLVENKVTTSYWYMAPVDGGESENVLEIAPD